MPEASAYGSLRLLKSTPFQAGTAGKQPAEGCLGRGCNNGFSRLAVGAQLAAYASTYAAREELVCD